MNTAQKMKFSIKDFFSKCDQIRRKLWIWSHLLKKSLMENFTFCVVENKRQGRLLEKSEESGRKKKLKPGRWILCFHMPCYEYKLCNNFYL